MRAIAELAEPGELRARVSTVLPLAQAAKAHALAKDGTPPARPS
ncbi:zinc-binding dehydrogenase [Streptomyces incanus]|uniref:Zinc-binding dehydrogenase n=1 Tax=Streptomyces incanus TaxID=887453 RepID=A0ABW0XX56_9ACTN